MTRSIERELEKRGIEYFAAFAEERMMSKERALQCNPAPLWMIRQAIRRISKGRINFNILQTLIAINYIRKVQPDIVQVHVIHHGFFDYNLLFAYLAKINVPVVFTLHDMWAITGGCYHLLTQCTPTRMVAVIARKQYGLC